MCKDGYGTFSAHLQSEEFLLEGLIQQTLSMLSNMDLYAFGMTQFPHAFYLLPSMVEANETDKVEKMLMLALEEWQLVLKVEATNVGFLGKAAPYCTYMFYREIMTVGELDKGRSRDA